MAFFLFWGVIDQRTEGNPVSSSALPLNFTACATDYLVSDVASILKNANVGQLERGSLTYRCFL